MRLFGYFKILVAVAMLGMWSTGASAKNRFVDKIYAFGIAASFNDSVVYFTDVQQVDSVWLENKTNFLVDRSSYSYQLRDYLARKGEQHRTCIFVYALNVKDITKKYLSMKNKYVKNGNFDIKMLDAIDFSFTSVKSYEETDENDSVEQVDKKKARKKTKEKGKRKKPFKGEEPADVKKDEPAEMAM